MGNVVYTSGFVDYVVFSHNGENGTESKTTLMCRRVRRVAAPGCEVVVYDCRLV